ncbi:MAG: hypothetical protein RUMPE_00592 [Eubacteriales bacterium SKADARSKE-1]|nr:hypothetical protein [Eubacteriales bacterium SKADARSKE-1]
MRKNKILLTLLASLMFMLCIQEPLVFSDEKDKDFGTPHTIVSLTSYPKRYEILTYTLKSLSKQTVAPDIILLNLCNQENTDEDKNVINQILIHNNLQDKVKINWINEKIGPYGKLIPALKLFPESTIITIDDDMEYLPNFVENLLKENQQFPNYIISNLCSPLRNDCYLSWGGWRDEAIKKHTPTQSVVLYGVGGVLYPPHSFNNKVFDKDLFMSEFTTTDDIWLTFCAIINGTKIVKTCDIKDRYNFIYENSMQKYGFSDIPTLTSINTNTKGKRALGKDHLNLIKVKNILKGMGIEKIYLTDNMLKE